MIKWLIKQLIYTAIMLTLIAPLGLISTATELYLIEH